MIIRRGRADEQNKRLAKADQDWLAGVRGYVRQHLTSAGLSVAGLAHHVSMSESTLLRRVKKLTGLTTGQYIRALRLDEARRLLESRSNYSVEQVAFLVGYQDARSFRRSFRARFGQLPSALLKD